MQINFSAVLSRALCESAKNGRENVSDGLKGSAKSVSINDIHLPMESIRSSWKMTEPAVGKQNKSHRSRGGAAHGINQTEVVCGTNFIEVGNGFYLANAARHFGYSVYYRFYDRFWSRNWSHGEEVRHG